MRPGEHFDFPAAPRSAPCAVPNPDALAASHAYCHEATRRHARSFYFSSFALPREKKRAAYAVYAYCRYADDLVDRASSPEGLDAILRQLANDFDHILEGGRGDLPFAPAFAWAVRRYGIEKQYFLDLLRGVAMDLGPVKIPDWPALRDYCYHVASVVGLMMSRIFELRDPAGLARAIDLGIAMQLTNIARDVGEDWRNGGRVYLPASELAEYHVDLTGEMNHPAEPGTDFVRLMQFQIARARDFYARAEPGIPLLADDGSQYTVWLMRHVYAGILDEIERQDYRVLDRRAATSFSRKILLALKARRALKGTRKKEQGGMQR
jgi:phytoene synthase